MFAVVIVCLTVILGCCFATAEPTNPTDLWSLEKPGDVVLHGVFPLRDPLSSRTRNLHSYFGFNFEGLTWMAAMIRRISEINQERVFHGNITLGYSIRDSSNDPSYGKRQTLSILNKIINKDASDRVLHVPVVIGPASDRVQASSKKLYELFDVPRISYTTTSSRFDLGHEKIIRTVPSDILHVEALLRLLEDMRCKEVIVVASRAEIWQRRVNAFQINMKKRKMIVKNVVYIDTARESSLHLSYVGSQVVVVFAEANIARIIIQREKRRSVTWITVGEFDDPLLSVFDGFGKLLKKTIVRNLKQEARDYKGYFMSRTLENHDNGNFNKSAQWVLEVEEKFIQQCRGEQLRLPSAKDLESRRKECTKNAFQEKIKSFFGGRDAFRSSLTLQGVEDAVNIIVSSLQTVLRNCSKRKGDVSLRSCIRASKANYWFDSLRNKDNVVGVDEHRTLTGRYSIQVLRRIEKGVLGKRMPFPRKWTFKKVSEWNITEDFRIIRNVKRLQPHENEEIGVRKLEDSVKNSSMGPPTDHDSCTRCDEALAISNCKSDVTVIDWKHGFAIALYTLEMLTLLAVVLSFLYFLKHRNSPIMILCYSWPDNVMLGVLCLFCFLPIMHIGEISSLRCTTLWPMVNVIFGFYSSLLLTKTLFVQDLLKCEVATERPGRRMAFSVFTVALLLVILSTTFPIFGFPTVLRFACPSRGVIVLCDVRGNIGVISSMAFNWILLLVLCVLAGLETAKERKNFCRTENLLGVAASGLVSYTCLIIFAYFNLTLKHYLVVTFIRCVVYLTNPSICLAFVYLPTLRLVSTWLRQHIRQKRNLTTIKRAQVMSSKRHSAGPLNSLFSTGFSTGQSLLPLEQSGYYFDLRPASVITDMSYPNSLVHDLHEPSRVIIGRRLRGGAMMPHDCLSFQSGPSMDGLETLNRTESCNSVYDNFSTTVAAEDAVKDAVKDVSPQELMREISSYWGNLDNNSDILRGEIQNEDVAVAAVDKMNNWPSLERLRASDL